MLEIGSGLGTLTGVLLDKGAIVTAVEFDKTLADTLPSKFINKQLTVINQDIRKFNFETLPKDYKIAANIPYYLTAVLIRLLAESKNQPKIAVLLVQKEVAQRVCAKPSEMSILSVSAQMYFECSLGVEVKAELFTPPPKVDSQVIVLKKRRQPYFGDIDSKLLFRLIKAGFSERRKKLRSSLSGGLNITKEQADVMLIKAGINNELRAQNLNLDDWITLFKVWQN